MLGLIGWSGLGWKARSFNPKPSFLPKLLRLRVHDSSFGIHMHIQKSMYTYKYKYYTHRYTLQTYVSHMHVKHVYLYIYIYIYIYIQPKTGYIYIYIVCACICARYMPQVAKMAHASSEKQSRMSWGLSLNY